MAGDSFGQRAEGAYGCLQDMSAFVFPYGIRFQEDGRLDVFPALEVDILGRGNRGIHSVFIIDSGATTSLIPRGDADLLGIRISAGKKSIIRGVGDFVFVGYVHLLRIRLAGKVFRVPFIIADRLDCPRILGREGIFSRFGIFFHEAGRRTAFLDASTEKKFIDSIFSF